jgi:hypothetical protein
MEGGQSPLWKLLSCGRQAPGGSVVSSEQVGLS